VQRTNWPIGAAARNRRRQIGICEDGVALWLASGGDGLGTLLNSQVVCSERQVEFSPYGNHRVGQLLDQPNVMPRGWRDPQSFGAPDNRRIVDRLDVDAVPIEQDIARLLA
jgi:hypothetical protein